MPFHLSDSRLLHRSLALLITCFLSLIVGPTPLLGAEPEPGTALIHYHRADGEYTDWGLHVWRDTVEEVTWGEPLAPAGEDDFGLFWVVRLAEGAQELGLIVHKGDEKDPGPDQFLDLTTANQAWILSADLKLYTTEPDPAAILPGNIDQAQAHWVNQKSILWDVALPADAAVSLAVSGPGNMQLTEDGILGGGIRFVPLTPESGGPSQAIRSRFPHLASYALFTLPETELSRLPAHLRARLAIQAVSPEGKLLAATGLQIPGVLDDLFAYSGQLGVTWQDRIPTLRLWAPTAKNVRLYLYADADPNTEPEILRMSRGQGGAAGVWEISGEVDWAGMFYLYEVRVYVPSTQAVESNLVTDPYSFSLSTNSARSQIVDLSDPALKPEGWDGLVKSPLAAPEDAVIYELHVRDFSVYDQSVAEELRGTYSAFTLPDSAGVKHLQNLAQAGLTHLHLLPVFDIATIDEEKANWQDPDPDLLAELPPDSAAQQAAVNAVRDTDSFNWGYDPFHYTVPEGSYSTDPAGSPRILEFRQMVQALNQMGLRVVMDVVYNHTHAAGQSEKSVLDRIVPGYYHRLNANGAVETSTCCPNTATEQAMMQKLILDSLHVWATQYKIDGFRFDLMGHHMKENMVAVRAHLDDLSLERDGVDGPAIYIYGEGWNFGEVADNARGVNATQLNLAGTGIGSFSDRLRDAVRGVGPFDTGENLQKQGFVTGLFTDPNALDQGGVEAQRRRLLHLTDQIRVGLAGNLANYPFIDSQGRAVTGAEVDYNGQPAGYTADPQEQIVYASKHDNQTLFDVIQLSAPATATLADRVRMHNLGLSIVAFSQGVPFFQAGDDLLRSKSMDRDSYNSGDWFNLLDWTYQTNGWGRGLPMADKNQRDWPILQPLLANPELQPSQEDILTAANHFQRLLQMRASSPLFHLRSANQIQGMVRFLDSGPEQLPGNIVMAIADVGEGDDDVDPDRELLLVWFNATPQTVISAIPAFTGMELTLHPLQALLSGPEGTASFRPETGEFSIPARSAMLFEAASLTDGFRTYWTDLDQAWAALRANPPALEEVTDRAAPQQVSFPGSYAEALGGANWAPDDPMVQATDQGDGNWRLTLDLPAGAYEFKVAINGSWDENYGLNGESGGPNLPFTLENDGQVTLSYQRDGDQISASVGGTAQDSGQTAPEKPTEEPIVSVGFPGSYAPALGGTEWAPADPVVQAQDDDGDGVWTLTMVLPGGSYEFKAALNGSWAENYGLNGERDGANVTLDIPDPEGQATLIYDQETHQIRTIVTQLAVVEPDPILGDGLFVRSALAHDSRQDSYRTPFGAVSLGGSVALRLRSAVNDVERVSLVVADGAAQSRTTIPMHKVATQPADDAHPTGYDWWEVRLTTGAQVTVYSYLFAIEDGAETLYVADDGRQDGGPGAIYTSRPLAEQGWDIYNADPAFTAPSWAANAVIYQIFPDRFRNGDPSNDQSDRDWFYPQERGHRFKIEPWNTIVPDPQPNDPALNPEWYGTWNSTFYGGDLQGVWDKLDYLQALGVTAIYFNPLFDSPSNHRYDGRNYTDVDPHLAVLGDAAQNMAFFDQFAQAVADRGMGLILDGVPNHLSSDSPLFDRFGRYNFEGACESEQSLSRDFFFFDPAIPAGTGSCAGDVNYRGWAGVSTLPQVNTGHPDVLNAWFGDRGHANFWLDKAGVVGWRIDVVPDVVTVNPRFFEEFRTTIKATHADAMLYAETWGEGDVRERVLGDEFDSTMNYRFRNAVLGFLRDTDFTEDGDGGIPALSATEFEAALRAIQEDYPTPAFATVMNLISSHDVNRAVRVLDHDGVDYTTLTPKQGFIDGRKRLGLAAVLQFTLPGAPTIYYGDEVGLTGFGSEPNRDDPYNRQPFPWPDAEGYAGLPAWRQQDGDLLAHYQQLGQLRGQHSFLRTGSWESFVVDDAGLYIFGRRDASGAALVALNRSQESQSAVVELAGYLPYNSVLMQTNAPLTATVDGGGVLTLSVDAMDYQIWLTGPETTLAPPSAPVIHGVEGSQSVSLEIETEDEGAANFVVWRSRIGGGYEPVVTVPADSLVEFNQLGLTNSQTYYYRVTARTAEGLESPPSPSLALVPHYQLNRANLEEPTEIAHTLSALTATTDLVGLAVIDGVSNAAGLTPGLLAQVGFAPDGGSTKGWRWVDGVYAGDREGGDLFRAALLPEAAGDYVITWRFSTTGGRDWQFSQNQGRLTVTPGPDVEAPRTPFRVDELFASGDMLALAWRVSRSPDMHGYELCRADVTLGQSGCEVRIDLPAQTQIYTDTAVTTGHTYVYTVQSVDTSFNRSAPSQPLTLTAELSFVDVTWRVRVPAETPAEDVIFIAGDNAELFGGSFNPNLQPLTDLGEGIWTWTGRVKEGTVVQYKYTRGNWESVEQWGRIAGLENRVVEIQGGAEKVMLIDNTPTDWGGEGPDDLKAVQLWRDPLVIAVEPKAESEDVAPLAISVTFNMEAGPTAEMDDVITVTGPNGTPIAGSVTSGDGRTYLFSPEENLGPGRYTVTVDHVTATAPLGAEYEWAFTVR